MKSTKRNTFFGLAALGALGLGYSVYKSFITSDKPSSLINLGINQERKSYTRQKVAIIVSESILAIQLPIQEILKNTKDVVFVLAPTIAKDEFLRENEVDSGLSFKVIETGTAIGCFHVLKHIKATYNIFNLHDFLPSSTKTSSDNEQLTFDLEEYVNLHLNNFLQNVVELPSDSTSIQETVNQYIYN
ncbi:Putative peroxisomal proteins import protein [Komagataella phaffii CBS 7435]|uniref:Peroxisome assembly protein 22 n=2 Tax=Komagataella TaxID=460517 RepID=PEX22_PICPA|nr:RecName: Full=Peroxisome assembly protein 22; AltName: Full=Peroxin-22 [Komagataella pastoris]AAD45664.1 peroxisomal integral membrane protein [Komagataella pastoris]AOA63541.1 GQ67_03664T0 [Komagataella phaffii]CAH2449596.1 Putative peroxisomal proteins import protein [Komagataella phaffii CBS 7435]SCV12223.1 Putative peroxisomal proteins import protein [Komagataella phaffii CBS 7435]